MPGDASRFDITGFDPKSLLATEAMGRATLRYGLNEVIFSQGDRADAVFYIQSGTVKISVMSAEGKEAVVGILGAGDFCGERCLNGKAVRVTAATAMNDCVVVRIERSALVRLVQGDPAFAEWMLLYLLERNNRIESDLADQILNSSEKRLARLLLILASDGKDGELKPLVPMISQSVMAEMIGTTRARVNFFMNKFRQLGLIDYNGALHVHSSLTKVLDQKKTIKGWGAPPRKRIAIKL